MSAAASGVRKVSIEVPVTGPITDQELGDLFTRLTARRHLVLAVSGGADSMALLHLVDRWRVGVDPEEAPSIVVATVDHGLRPESAAEASFVAVAAAARGLTHRTLVWTGEKPKTGVQEHAREARYALIWQLALELAPGYGALVVTAHHQDDLVETFLMRLARGSGLDGLVGMQMAAPNTILSDLARPFLAVPKQRLIATLEVAGQTWIEDPSNENPAFERVRLRRLTASLQDAGLSGDTIGLSIRRLARAQAALAAASDTAYAHLVGHNDGTWATLKVAPYFDLAADLGVRVLQRVLMSFGGRGWPPNLADTERLHERMVAEWQVGPLSNHSLGGCLIEADPDGDQVHVFREARRDALPVTGIATGTTVRWDNRFAISARKAAGPGPFTVRALGEDGMKAVDALGRGPIKRPRGALLTAPSIWRDGTLLAVPTLRLIVPELNPSNETGPLFSVEALLPRVSRR